MCAELKALTDPLVEKLQYGVPKEETGNTGWKEREKRRGCPVFLENNVGKLTVMMQDWHDE